MTDRRATLLGMKITERPPNGNPGIVPPWLQKPQPIKILPMPDGWEAPVPSNQFTLVVPVAR